MSQPKGRKRKISHDDVLAFAQANPAMFQAEIATFFNTTQSRVSHILRAAGLEGIYRGRPLERKAGWSDEEFKWEQILQNAGLGMERGMRINKHRVLYGYDPAKEVSGDASVTANSSFYPLNNGTTHNE